MMLRVSLMDCCRFDVCMKPSMQQLINKSITASSRSDVVEAHATTAKLVWESY